jgi:hypothetical protein
VPVLCVGQYVVEMYVVVEQTRVVFVVEADELVELAPELLADVVDEPDDVLEEEPVELAVLVDEVDVSLVEDESVLVAEVVLLVVVVVDEVARRSKFCASTIPRNSMSNLLDSRARIHKVWPTSVLVQ